MADWVWPNGSKTMPGVNSPFGWRIHPLTKKRRFHYGTDFYMPDRINRAITAGRVVNIGYVKNWTGGGYGVWVKNWDGSLAKWFHGVDGSAFVRLGQDVNPGDPLSRTGMTGTATGVHLHLEISPAPGGANSQVDPVEFLRSRIAASAGGDSKPFDPEEDDMTPEQATQLDAVYKALFGPNNGPAKSTHALGWYNIDGSAQSVRYGLLPITIHNQNLIAQQAGKINGLAEAVAQLQGGGQVNMGAITAAAEAGARDALARLTISIED